VVKNPEIWDVFAAATILYKSAVGAQLDTESGEGCSDMWVRIPPRVLKIWMKY
jgi:hypothetical protein